MTAAAAGGAGFDAAVAVSRDAGGRWRGAIAEGWDIGGVPNGGYVLAVALQPVLDALGSPDPLTVTAHFLDRAAAGPAEIAVEPLKTGGRHRIATSALAQDGRERARLLATVTDLSRAAGPERVTAVPPDLPPPDACVTPAPVGDFDPPPITDRVELRIDPVQAGFALGRPSGTAEMSGWLRFADGRQPDTASLPLFADAMPPAVFNLDLPRSWVPTVELTVHVRARPAPGWLRAVFRARVVAGGYLAEDGELWDSAGRLVAMSRQLALMPRA